MEIKIKLPKRFYTVKQLAERWECNIEDIHHLIETKQLTAVPYLAAREGKKNLVIFAHRNEKDAATAICKYDRPAHATDDSYILHGSLEDGETDKRQVIQRVYLWHKGQGDYDPVITTAEISRFEREHSETTEETAQPSSWPWGDYETPLLRILAEAVNHFCLDGTDRYPKKITVVNWIMARMEASGMKPTEHLPGVVETLISPRPYVPHRQRKQRKA